MRRSAVGRAIGRNVVGPVVSGMDLDSVLGQIDLQDLLENKVDLNRVLNQVDINQLLSKVDLNAQLDRIDMDKLMSKVDINKIIERSDLETIINRSSSSFFGQFIHLVRARMALADQWIQRICRCAACTKEPWLPPRPGIDDTGRTYLKWPDNTRDFGVAVQFRCCGQFTRGIAWLIDNVLVALTVALLIWIIEKFQTYFDNRQAEANQPTTTGGGEDVDGEMVAPTDYLDESDEQWTGWIIGPSWLLFEFCYSTLFLGCFGRTVGLSVMGLLVVNNDGHRVSFLRVLMRNIVTPFNVMLFGWVLGLTRRDGKNWNDLFSCTAVVYAWNAVAAAKVIEEDNNFDFAMSVPNVMLDLENSESNSGVSDSNIYSGYSEQQQQSQTQRSETKTNAEAK